MIDARRGEVFVAGPARVAPARARRARPACVGDGAVRYRDVLEATGARRPA